MPRSSQACRRVSALGRGSLGTIFLCGGPAGTQTDEVVAADFTPLLFPSEITESAQECWRKVVFFLPVPQIHICAPGTAGETHRRPAAGVVGIPCSAFRTAHILEPNQGVQPLPHAPEARIPRHLGAALGTWPDRFHRTGGAMLARTGGASPPRYRKIRTARRRIERARAPRPLGGSRSPRRQSPAAAHASWM